jgi:putative membrane protein
MGAADIVPGVSGGTMAFILGIYEELLAAINAINLEFIRHILTLRWREAFREFPWRFLLALGLGIAAAILTLTKGLHWALETHPSLLWAFFFGLIIASIVIVSKRVGDWSAVNILAAIAAALGAYLLVGLSPSETPHTPLLLFLSGALAICAMILPGISGAFILVLLGKYRYILAALVAFEITSIAIVALGAVFGLVGFARLLRWLLREKHDLVVGILTGFMTGALRKVWPWKSYELSGDVIVAETNFIPVAFDGEVTLALLFMAMGTILVLLAEHFANRRQVEPASTAN